MKTGEEDRFDREDKRQQAKRIFIKSGKESEEPGVDCEPGDEHKRMDRDELRSSDENQLLAARVSRAIATPPAALPQHT